MQLNEYDPWGGVSRSEGSIDPDTRFTGQKLDAETGLYYYGGRYYDAEISRFVSADPFVTQPSNPQNLDRYSYVTNNPQNYIDPSGYEGEATGGETSAGSYAIPLYGWVKFFMDLFSSEPKHDHRPKRTKSVADAKHQPKVTIENGGQGGLKNVLVYDSQGSCGGDDYPGCGSGGLGLTFVQALGSDRPVNKVKKGIGPKNILFGVGFSAIALTGIEGSFGIVFNPGLFGGKFDIGVFSSVGAGSGLNLSADAFAGYVEGPSLDAVRGLTVNLNTSAGSTLGVSGTMFTDPQTGQIVGGTLGPSWGLPQLPFGVSLTASQTGVISGREILSRIWPTVREIIGNIPITQPGY